MDYSKLGIKIGLEVHQQLDTGKLFCRCPSLMREEKADVIIERRLRPVASELGEYDAAALEAFRKGQFYEYEFYSDSNCLIEADEEPIQPMNEQALKTAIEVSLMAESKVLDEVHVMRKQVIDGSNTSGFQRTALIALEGKLKTKSKEIGINSIILEEDAARQIERNEQKTVYRLDRLGIPLIELTTAPEICSPEETKEVALLIGELFRRTGKVKRGLGTIRQDINISIEGGARIEVKGVQELEMIDVFVKREIERQLALIEIRKELQEKGAKEEELKFEPKELNELLHKSNSKTIQNTIKSNQKILAVKLKGFASLLGKEVQPERRLGTEISDYVKARTQLKGIIHSDELPAYGITERELEEIKKHMNCESQDAFVFVCAEKEKALDALKTVIERAKYCFKGVPEETRNALQGGNSEYSRPLPGAARMYPETDIPSIKIERREVEELRKKLPLSAEQRFILYINKYRLSPQLAEKMKLSNYARFFEELCSKGADPTQTAVLLLEGLVQLKREGIETERINEKMIEEVLLYLKEGKITKDVLLEVLKQWAEKPAKKLNEIISSMSLGSLLEGELRKIVINSIEKNSALIRTPGVNVLSALMGDVMIQVKGRATGSAVNKILKEELEKRK